MKFFKRSMCAILALVAVLTLAACTNTGDLVLPVELTRGVEVTADEWKAAFDFSSKDSFSIYMKTTQKNGDKVMRGEGVYMFDSDKTYAEMITTQSESDDDEQKEIVVKYYTWWDKNESLTFHSYVYDSEKDKWERDNFDLDLFMTGSYVLNMLLEEYRDKYGSAEYSAYKKGYVFRSGSGKYTNETIIRINDGALVAMIYREFDPDDDDDDNSSILSVQFYAVGSTAVNIPAEAK